MTEQEQLEWIENEVSAARSEAITLIPVDLDDSCPTIPYVRAAAQIPAEIFNEAPELRSLFWELP